MSDLFNGAPEDGEPVPHQYQTYEVDYVNGLLAEIEWLKSIIDDMNTHRDRVYPLAMADHIVELVLLGKEIARLRERVAELEAENNALTADLGGTISANRAHVKAILAEQSGNQRLQARVETLEGALRQQARRLRQVFRNGEPIAIYEFRCDVAKQLEQALKGAAEDKPDG